VRSGLCDGTLKLNIVAYSYIHTVAHDVYVAVVHFTYWKTLQITVMHTVLHADTILILILIDYCTGCTVLVGLNYSTVLYVYVPQHQGHRVPASCFGFRTRAKNWRHLFQIQTKTMTSIRITLHAKPAVDGGELCPGPIQGLHCTCSAAWVQCR
jgi:hypothetical protein